MYLWSRLIKKARTARVIIPSGTPKPMPILAEELRPEDVPVEETADADFTEGAEVLVCEAFGLVLVPADEVEMLEGSLEAGCIYDETMVDTAAVNKLVASVFGFVSVVELVKALM